MTDESKDVVSMYEDDDARPASRILPSFIVLSAIAGFISLAWYAYNSNTQALQDGELVIVEADSSPMKEKPLDPGGMQFPNQDKTIYDTFASSSSQAPSVERVMPPPEEPMAKEETVETKTFVNEKLQQAEEMQPPLVIKVPQEQPVKTAVVEAEKAATPAPLALTEESTAKPVEFDKPAEKIVEKPIQKPVEVKEEKAEAVKPAPEKTVEKTEPKKPAAAKVSGGSSMAQLGAYKSEGEAKADFARIQKKHSALAGLSSTIIRADLGDKGIFYRLRVGSSNAKTLCSALSSAGQACMVVK